MLRATNCFILAYIFNFFVFIFLFFLNSCTYNISMAHTEGTAQDVIDDNATNTPNVSPVVNIPLTSGLG